MTAHNFIKLSDDFYVDADFKDALADLGLTSMDAVFSFDIGQNLTKKNLAPWRSRLRFKTASPATTMFAKRYDQPPIAHQLKNWLAHRKKISCADADASPAEQLIQAGINTPKTIALGRQWQGAFEKRSFIITEKIPNAESLERKLPDCFTASAAIENLKLRKKFIADLAGFIKKFHATGFRHRDLYLCHIFYDQIGKFYLIDLARSFKPKFLARRYRTKDLAQLYYSAPARYFTKADRLRFYLLLTGKSKLTAADKRLIAAIKRKAKRMAAHDIKHGRTPPFAT